MNQIKNNYYSKKEVMEQSKISLSCLTSWILKCKSQYVANLLKYKIFVQVHFLNLKLIQNGGMSK